MRPLVVFTVQFCLVCSETMLGVVWTFNTTNLAVPARFHTSQLVLHVVYRVSDKHKFSYNYFVTRGRRIKLISIPSDTVHLTA